MGNEHGGNARFLLDAADLLARLQAQAGVQVGQWLVQQQHAGHLDQRAGDGHALLLAAGQLAGLAIQQLLNLHQPGGLLRALNHLHLGQLIGARQVLQGEQNVLQHCHVRIQGIILEHQADAALFGGQLGHVVLAKEYLARRRLLQAADHIQRGALAAAGGAQQADQLAIRNFKIEVIDRDHLVRGLFVAAGEDFRQILQDNFQWNTPFFCMRFLCQYGCAAAFCACCSSL